MNVGQQFVSFKQEYAVCVLSESYIKVGQTSEEMSKSCCRDMTYLVLKWCKKKKAQHFARDDTCVTLKSYANFHIVFLTAFLELTLYVYKYIWLLSTKNYCVVLSQG